VGHNALEPWPHHLSQNEKGSTVSERAVIVSGREEKVTVFEKSKGVWIAVGHYKGDRIEVTRQTENAALSAWAAAAEALSGVRQR
jgi:hypothetical protein